MNKTWIILATVIVTLLVIISGGLALNAVFTPANSSSSLSSVPSLSLSSSSKTSSSVSSSSSSISSVSSKVSTSASSSSSSSVSSSSSANTKNVQVFFGYPLNSDKWNTYTPVSRSTAREDVATFVIEEWLKGPTDQEKQQGLTTGGFGFENRDLSKCGGKQFVVTIQNQKAVVEFCLQLELGDGVGTNQFNTLLLKNLTQFPTVSSVEWKTR